ncbi:PsbP-related protein [Brevibacillus fluminis]|uniref:PsbP-related protein n=1 Tax=Brevibacillus fluminis TaxID=511487 RepID=UPI003F8868FD
MMNRRKVFMIALQILSISFLLFGCSTSNSSHGNVEYLMYKDNEHHFSISYPSTWSIDSKQPNVGVMFDSPKENDQDLYTENVSAGVFSLPTEATSPIENYVDGMIDTIKKQTPEMNMIKTSSLKINNVPAIQIIYTAKRDNLDLAYKVTYLLKGRVGYIIVFTCLNGEIDKFSPVVDTMINSFVITD